MHSVIVPIVALILILSGTSSQQCDYYWRDYTGVIPDDAIPAGEDINGHETYIAQVYIHYYGLFVGQIYPGVKEVEVAAYYVFKKNYAIKILCSSQPNRFKWIVSTATSFHVDTIGKHAVVGGYDHLYNYGIIHIGRAMHQGKLTVGHLTSYQVGAVNLNYVANNVVAKAGSFEVLICEKSRNRIIELGTNNGNDTNSNLIDSD